MTQNLIYADDDTQLQQSASLGTQLLAFASAACLGLAVLFGSVVLGAILFLVVVVTMNVDAGEEWITRIRQRVAQRDCRLLRQVVSPQ
ncbi:MAG TPA: hypothetical protein VHJ78_09990 [Actinomycetota bacterium]|nr:hypothetical protein [Actinomycetota bacterium]